MVRTGRQRSHTACCRRSTVSGDKCLSPVSTLTRAGTFSMRKSLPSNSMWYVTFFLISVSYHALSSGIVLSPYLKVNPSTKARHPFIPVITSPRSK